MIYDGSNNLICTTDEEIATTQKCNRFEHPKGHREHQSAHQSWFKSAKEHI
jgi:hypothetical protein